MGETVRVNASDPLNLVGIITPGPRVPALHTNAIIFRDGVPVTVEEGRKTTAREDAPPGAGEAFIAPAGVPS
jgi:ATP-dependent Lhr-like helicase